MLVSFGRCLFLTTSLFRNISGSRFRAFNFQLRLHWSSLCMDVGQQELLRSAWLGNKESSLPAREQEPPFPPRNLNTIFVGVSGVGIPDSFTLFKSLKLIQPRARSHRKNWGKARSQHETHYSRNPTGASQQNNMQLLLCMLGPIMYMYILTPRLDFLPNSCVPSSSCHTWINDDFQGNFTPPDAEIVLVNSSPARRCREKSTQKFRIKRRKVP